ncbi:MAG: MarR family transcriptional regulator [SAR324 cluster bacterium]|nr:MarR family transcriptional regulator [SAR324 cluster bacterium]
MDKLNNELIDYITKVTAQLEKGYELELTEFFLNHQQLLVLDRINKEGPISQKDIASQLNLNKAHVSKIVKKLVSLEYLQAIGQDGDARLKLWTTSFTGIQVSTKAFEKISAQNQNWAPELSAAEVNQMIRILSKIKLS